MFGKMLTAQDWNRLTGTDKGREIYDHLRMFHECPIELKPALPDLEPRLKSALWGVGVEIHRAAAISLAGLRSSMDAVPETMKGYLARDIAGAVQRSLSSNLDDEVRGWIGEAPLSRERTFDVVGALSDGINRPVRDHLEKRYGEILTPTTMGDADLPFPLLGLLVDLVGAVCGGNQKKVLALTRLTDLIREGNVPMGSVPPRCLATDFTYAVLVA